MPGLLPSPQLARSRSFSSAAVQWLLANSAPKRQSLSLPAAVFGIFRTC